MDTVNLQGLLRWFAEQGVEPDQRLNDSLPFGVRFDARDSNRPRSILGAVSVEFCAGTSPLSRLRIKPQIGRLIRTSSGQGPATFDNPAETNFMLGMVLRRAIKAIPQKGTTKTLGTGDFVRALSQKVIDIRFADDADYVRGALAPGFLV